MKHFKGSWEREIVVEAFELGDYCYNCTLHLTGYAVCNWVSDDRSTWGSKEVVIESVVFENLEQYDGDGEITPIIDVAAVRKAIRKAYADSIIEAFLER